MEYNNFDGHQSNDSRKVRYASGSDIDIGEDCSEISRSSLKCIGDANSDVSVSTSILDFEDLDAKSLKRKLEEYEYKNKYLQNEIGKINTELVNERVKTTSLEKKLQFVKDNQEVFMRLKEAYINMKYNEAAGRKMIEIREKGIQTWKGVLCSSCIESEDLRRQIEILVQKYSQVFVASPGEIEQLVNTVKYLKDLIVRREESWSINMERENKLQRHIEILKQENESLRKCMDKEPGADELHNTHMKPDERIIEEEKVETMRKCMECMHKDMEKLKKIIVKFDRSFRCETQQNQSNIVYPLNDKEEKIVQQLVKKYNSKIPQPIIDHVRSRSLSADKANLPQHRRPSSPIRTSRRRSDSASKFVHRTHSPDRKTECAIMMMDCLFD
ncbi:uncharacterized protein LOC115878656 isoform X2 [Sitophilus oryzae]|uniref:Uncharacterized protein LOC115878656 isoform X2 n=1 Tax=Sitophilus oryzae TaxID=7048 RepID=A0A6J2XIX6_SITOR|nr:uncharacterized protein LOC115878656 isoform X2 [Sitophilus oryzae]